jgi:hypothetical protein
MRKNLPLASLLLGSVLASGVTMAQTDRFAYAVTDISEQGFNWQYVRKLNLQTGEYGQVLLSGNDMNALNFDANSKKQLTSPVTDARFGNTVNAAFGTGVAAMAFDRKNNRLYYTPMMFDQLRYIDLKSMKVYYVTGQGLSGKSEKSPDQGNIITRMVIASDGYGYAMTNDGTQMIRFSTGKKLEITDLGSLVDDPANKGVSVHNSCSSYGGDMIADDNGNLYVFSARNNVFRINISSRVATYLGVISNLPNGFTVNGAAVNTDNKVLVASAAQAGTYFMVDMKSLAAAPYAVSGGIWQSSDLANGNLLASGNKKQVADLSITHKVVETEQGNSITLYPNPVTANQFLIRFGNLQPGSYTIQVTDVMGRQVHQQSVNISGDNQSQLVKLQASTAKAVYLLKLLNTSSKAVFSTKLVVQ